MVFMIGSVSAGLETMTASNASLSGAGVCCPAGWVRTGCSGGFTDNGWAGPQSTSNCCYGHSNSNLALVDAYCLRYTNEVAGPQGPPGPQGIPGTNASVDLTSINGNISSANQRISALESWKETITDTITQIWAAITGHTTRIDTLENANETCTSCGSGNASSSPYFKYLSYSDRKNIVCGYAKDNHLAKLIDLKVNCTITYRQYSSGERATCSCREIK